MRVFLVAAYLNILLISPSFAADLLVYLKTNKGVGIADAVATFHPKGDALQAGSVTQNGRPKQAINQKNQQFQPFMTVVPKGSKVDFINEDSVLHHVFSFSAAKKFSLKLFGTQETHSVDFDQPGIVVVGCNIHDDMIAYLKIVETPFAGKTDAQGALVLTNLPDGPGELRIWHPLMKAKRNELRVNIENAATAAPVELAAKFRRGARPVGDY